VKRAPGPKSNPQAIKTPEAKSISSSNSTLNKEGEELCYGWEAKAKGRESEPSTMPRPAVEVPLFWKACPKGNTADGLQYHQMLESSDPELNVVSLTAVKTTTSSPGNPEEGCRRVTLDVMHPTPKSRGVQNLILSL